jgi:hypothetical protein
MSSNTPFPIDPELTAIAVAYKNPRYIADDVLPRVPVGVKAFKYRKWDKADSFTIPRTLVGRKGTPDKVEYGFTEDSAVAVDFGLDEDIPQDDITQAPEGYNPTARSVEQLTDLIGLDREVRVATMVFTAGNYAASNRVDVAAGDKWSNYTESSPLEYITTRMDSCIMRPNVLVMGQAVWTKLRQHPKVAKAIHGNSGDSGIVARQALASLLEIDEIIVGQAFLNSAKKGQTPTIARAWGGHAALLYRDGLADAKGRVTFGFTGQYGTRIAGTVPNPNIGIRGGVTVRAGETVKEVITANDLGYFLENVIA